MMPDAVKTHRGRCSAHGVRFLLPVPIVEDSAGRTDVSRETGVKFSEFLLAGCHCYVGYALS